MKARALMILAALALVPSVWRALRSPLAPSTLVSTEHTAEADRVLYGEKMNLNRADSAALELIPGIGPALARRIVDHRKKRGPFVRLEEIERVRGIGPKKRELISAWAEIGDRDGADRADSGGGTDTNNRGVATGCLGAGGICYHPR